MSICDRFVITGMKENLHIGYSHSSVPFIVLSILTMLLNIGVIYEGIKKRAKSGNEE